MTAARVQNFENWIFDWSGTLVDDLTMVLDATNHVFRHYGKPEMDRAKFRNEFRLPYVGFYEEYLPGVPLDELEEHFRVGFAASEAAGVVSPLLPYALGFLDHLNQANKRMFILSAMDASAFDKHVVELGVDHHFDATYAGVLDKRQQINLMIEKHQLDPEKTVFLGDMCHDIDTAKHGGVSSIALLTGYQDRAQLASASPDLLVQNLSDVQALLNA